MLGEIGLVETAIVLMCSIAAIVIWFATAAKLGEREQVGLASFEGPLRQGRVLTFDFDQSGNFLFANEAGDKFLKELDLEGAHWMQFRAAFIDRFPHIPSRIALTETPNYRVLDAQSPADPVQIGLENHETGVTVQVAAALNYDLATNPLVHRVFAEIADLNILRDASENAPHPIWMTKRDGRVVWTNAAYRTLDGQVPRNASAPDAPLFTLPQTRRIDAPDRLSVRDTDRNRTYWFDVISRSCDEGELHFATDVHAVVSAENAQRNFVQTLAKTFAHLSTGLAIFDRNRQLVLFNPALIDLTGLPADFLSARPNLFSVFDQLRNNQIMPEPKDYANWRERIADVVTAASDGSFGETWTLPGGQTYRITGRPHPDGAIAFLFHDISAEVSLTRRFRAETQVTQSALDELPDATAIAIFSQSGALLQANAPMTREWSIPNPLNEDATFTVTDATRIWQRKFQPSPVWGDIRDFVGAQSSRATWSGDTVGKDGVLYSVHVAPIATGATLVTFRKATALAPAATSKKGRGSSSSPRNQSAVA